MTFDQLEIGEEFMFFDDLWKDRIFIKSSEDTATIRIFGRHTPCRISSDATIFPISRERDYPEVRGFYQALLEECEMQV